MYRFSAVPAVPHPVKTPQKLTLRSLNKQVKAESHTYCVKMQTYEALESLCSAAFNDCAGGLLSQVSTY